MFNKILVANRGEIACRIVRTARRLGIATVAVYSDADRSALHVEMADEAVPIGPAPAAASYLSIENILAACRQTGADAVHPGYGLLSENASFARALENAGIIFIGPTADAIEAMGDKVKAKRIAAGAGVAVVPGHEETVSDADEAVLIARGIGYPVMLKAAAGGGGKGMRLVVAESGLPEAFQRARSESRSAFGDDRILIEKAIKAPRHIETQILADAHGNVIHLGERECSIQRRNQKIVEEAPSPFLDAAMREAMGAQAVALARAVGYCSAGTVEFIVDAAGNFYFLEMNTRLQVEHPVTELVTGLDIVEEMIRIAAGERLRIRQEDVRFTGWAIESRIYAEDPYRGFLPSVGRLSRYRPPVEGTSELKTVRIDSGVVEGSDISIFYDPLIAKLCTHAPTRDAAIDAMADALDAFSIEGIWHNIPFLSALMAHPRWREGRLSTGFISEEYPDGFHTNVPTGKEQAILAAIAVTVDLAERERLRKRARGSRGPLVAGYPEWVLMLSGERLSIRVAGETSARPLALDLSIGGAPAIHVETAWRPGERLWCGTIDGATELAQLRREGHALRVERRGFSVLARLLTPRVAALAALMPEKGEAGRSKAVLCPMPGLVVSVIVREGQDVEAGESLAIVEAMKMENVLRAERAGMIARILVKPGDSLAVDDVMMEFA